MGIKKLFSLIVKHPLLAGSLIMILGSNLFNAAQFVYHFITARFLGKVLYGDLASVISIVGIITVVQVATGLTITKFIASEKDEEKITGFVKFVLKISFWVGLVLMTIAFLTTPLLAGFLNITDKNALFLLGPILLTYLVLGSGRSVLQGLIKFDNYVVTLLVESVGKLFFSTLFLLLGFKVLGALMGFLVGTIFALFAMKGYLSGYLSLKTKFIPKIAPLFKYSLAALLQGLALTSMYTADLLLVKHFLPPDQAGVYASMTILGRVVFFATSPITAVMFPLVAKRHVAGQRYLNLFYLSIILVLIFSAGVILIYYFIPTLPIKLLFGNEFIEGSKYLWLFGVFMGILSIAALFTQFFLSIGKTKPVYLFFGAALLQIVLIWLFHGNIVEVVTQSILAASLLGFALLVYFVYSQPFRR